MSIFVETFHSLLFILANGFSHWICQLLMSLSIRMLWLWLAHLQWISICCIWDKRLLTNFNHCGLNHHDIWSFICLFCFILINLLRSCRRCIFWSWLLLHWWSLKWLLLSSALLATLRYFSSLLIQLRFDFFKLDFEHLLLIVQKSLLSDLSCSEFYFWLLSLCGSRGLGSLGLRVRCLVGLRRQFIENWCHTWFHLILFHYILLVIDDSRTASPIFFLKFLKRLIVRILIYRGLRWTIIEIEFQLVILSIKYLCSLFGRRCRILQQLLVVCSRSETFNVLYLIIILKSRLWYGPLAISLH